MLPIKSLTQTGFHQLYKATSSIRFTIRLKYCSTDNMASSVDIGRGLKMPTVGLGTWKSKPGEVERAVKTAIDIGYRHIDCAFAYGNEAEVGSAITEKISEGVVKREDLFVVSKLWNTYHAPADVRKNVLMSLELLKLKYLDLYLIHWPTAWKSGEEKFPKDENGNILYSDTHPTETYKAMEKLVEEGLVKHIGVSNFNREQIQHILDNATIRPATNQVEVHPYYNNSELVNFCQSKGVSITAYSPLGSADRPWADPNEPTLLEDQHLLILAKKYKKTPAQIVLRWLTQRNIIIIPKSITPARIKENLEIFDFALLKEDMAVIDHFDRKIPIVVPYITVDGKRVFRDRNAPNFPFR